MQITQQLGTMRVRDIITDEYDDMIVYVSVTLFLSMTTILLLILSL